MKIMYIKHLYWCTGVAKNEEREIEKPVIQITEMKKIGKDAANEIKRFNQMCYKLF